MNIGLDKISIRNKKTFSTQDPIEDARKEYQNLYTQYLKLAGNEVDKTFTRNSARSKSKKKTEQTLATFVQI